MPISLKTIVFFICTLALMWCVEGDLMANEIVDTTVIELREFDENSIEEYRESGDYIFDRKPPQPDSYLTRLLESINEWLNKVFRAGINTMGFSPVKLLVILGSIVALFWLIFKVNPKLIFRKGGGKKIILEYETSEENIHEIDFDEKLAEAITNRMYRKAIRLYYLKTLKQLADRDFISWRLDKTNRQYLFELKEGTFRSHFANITDLFNHVWYGHFPIDQLAFKNYEEQFQEFSNLISKPTRN